ncbi:MAG: polysaccharide pyruvyl transferase family protein [Caldimonas sp.]
MQILTWPTTNFGDRLNELVWPPLAPEVCSSEAPGCIVGIGSLLNHRLPRQPLKYVLGSGFGHGDEPTVDDTWRVKWVRGPETAKLLKRLTGRDYKVITDGAVMLSELFAGSDKRYDVSFVPHCSACLPGTWDTLETLTESLGIHLISPEQPPHAVIREISQSRKVLTEALHGAIVADAFGVPWIPLTRNGILGFKWIDWTSSMGLPYEPTRLNYRTTWFQAEQPKQPFKRAARRIAGTVSQPLLRRQLGRLVSSRMWHLSDRAVVRQKVAEIKAELGRLRQELAGSPAGAVSVW